MTTNQNEPNGNIRIGDAERNEAVSRLGAHYEAGRLSADEHSERVDQALRATTRNDLDALFTDLPGEGAGPQDARPGGGYRSGAPFGGPPWAARGPWRGPRVFGLPVPLVAILAFLTIAGLACSVLGGHPPVLLFVAAAIATVAILKRRRFGHYRA